MRMYFELIRDAAGQTNQPYDRSIRELNMHTRRGPNGLAWGVATPRVDLEECAEAAEFHAT